VTRVPAVDLLGAAMVDFAAGRRSPVWLRIRSGRRLTHDLAAYFALVTLRSGRYSTWSRSRCSTSAAGRPAMPDSCRPAG